MTRCYLDNVFLLFLPAHCSHVLQPLDLGCFSSLKSEYRQLLGQFVALTDSDRIGKARFLEFYAQARERGLRKKNIQSGWRATGLYPKNRQKPLASRWVVVPLVQTLSPTRPSRIFTPKKSSDILKILNTSDMTPGRRLASRKVAITFDAQVSPLVMKDREIEKLRTELETANPPKRRKSDKIQTNALPVWQKSLPRAIKNRNNGWVGLRVLRYWM
jgi:hypothetical protein